MALKRIKVITYNDDDYPDSPPPAGSINNISSKYRPLRLTKSVVDLLGLMVIDLPSTWLCYLVSIISTPGHKELHTNELPMVQAVKAVPRSSTTIKSAMIPPPTVLGTEAAMPIRKRATMIIGMLTAAAHRMDENKNPTLETCVMSSRP